jgi:hypothetical protein
MNRLRFSPNVPQVIALQDPEGDYKPDAEQVEYLLSDGRMLTLNTSDATRLNLLDLQPGETFSICKRLTEGQLPYIEISLSTATEQARAAQEIAAEAPPIPVPRRNGKRAAKVHELQPPAPVQPRLFDRKGTGTYGPAPQTQPAPAMRPAAPIPFNRAFVEVVKLVRDGLESVGEQWSDSSRQDAVSTVIIAGVNRGWIGPWERQS